MLVKKACFFYRFFGKSGPDYHENQNVFFRVFCHGPNTETEMVWTERPQSAGSYHKACAKAVDHLFASPRITQQSLQSHVRAGTSRPLAL
jgi:hypothetical protein